MKKNKWIYADDLDENTLKQFEECVNCDFVVEGALMPDAHLGYVAPIGSVLVTKDFIVPSWVGYDIGCGMTAAHIKGKDMLKKIRENQDKIFDAVKKRIPMGKGEINSSNAVTRKTKEDYSVLIEEFKKGAYNKEILQFLEGKAIRHIGSLGDGNHFIELSEDELGDAWITVHSGSRGVGFKVAEKYMMKVAGTDKEFEATHPIHKDSELGKEYLNVLDFGLKFALRNRLELIERTIKGIEDVLGEKIEFEVWTNKNHNHAIPENGLFIHRKGATPAKSGERGVIPGNMRDGCFLVEGLGNKEFIESSSHGAGRKYSRKDAKEKFSIEDFRESMKGIKGTISQGTLDESPMAYKDVFDVMDKQKDSVKIIKHLKPVINWKGERGRQGKNKDKN
ncbi:RtcB family protein [Candidatus Woesearchaeota archaeon]|nr:RtcB family protein [Candidatus Woesearchaeota archaeon]MCF7901085.1 RtcB family protein [Candidatus Woesearchaeota archaeon]MCF8013418.1 RtcB family protein [Candidatus Woesearchaeota archaeon]